MAVTAEAIAELAERTAGRSVGLEDDLFRAGFSSALLVRLWVSIGESLHVRVPVGIMFSAPTPRSLADRIAEFDASARPEGVTRSEGGAVDGTPRPASGGPPARTPLPGTGLAAGPGGGRGLSRRAARDALRRQRQAAATGAAPVGPSRGSV